MRKCKTCGHDEFPHNYRHSFQPRLEDRCRRKGVIPTKVRVFNDTNTVTCGGQGLEHIPAYRDYLIHAQTDLDARVIAFLLDGGSNRVTHWDDGHIELALVWTKVIE
jgi:hypothetical protein